MLIDLSTANIGDNFSRVRGSFSPTSLTSAAKITVPLGTSNPANSAMCSADLPTTCAFNFAPAQFLELAFAPNTNSSSLAFSSLLTKYTWCFFINSMNSL